MKKSLFLIPLALTTVLAACNGGGNQPASSSSSQESSESSSYSRSEEDSSSSSSSIDVGGWSEELKTLMQQYCGEILPYPEGKLTGEINFRERESNDGSTYLEIYDESPSFTLENYYEYLEFAEWNVVRDYSGNAVRSDAYGTKFVETIKTNAGKGYDVSYFFDEGWGDVKPGNVIWCYNTLSSSLTEETSWSEDDELNFEDGLTYTLPFMKMGSDYRTSHSSDDLVSVFDYCAIDLRKEYADVLVKDGFVLDESQSKANEGYVLTKTLESGSTVIAALNYSNGNLFKFLYVAKKETSSTWPSQILTEIETKANTEVVPLESSSDITSYEYYVKNGVAYILAKTSSSDVYDEYTGDLIDAGYKADSSAYGVYTNWEENLSVYVDYAYTENYDLEGITLVIANITPSSSYSSSWPSDVISSFLTKFEINVACPSLDSLPDTGKQIRYNVVDDLDARTQYWIEFINENGYWMGIDTTDEAKVKEIAAKTAIEEMAVFLEFFDEDGEVYKSYYDVLYKAGWHLDTSSGSAHFEDPTGALAVYMYTSDKTTSINVALGSKEEHSPVFEFEKSELVLGLGTETASNLKVDMLPYDVAYSCNDTTGKVSVDEEGTIIIAEDAIVGTEVTVTATMVVPNGETRTASLKVTVAERTPYTPATAADAVADLLNIYMPNEDEHYANHDENGDWMEFNCGFMPELTLDSLKTLIVEHLVPTGFVVVGEGWGQGQVQPDEYIDVTYDCQYIKYEADGVVLTYMVYLADDTLMFQISAALAE